MTGLFEDLSFILPPLEHFICDFLERASSGRLPTCNVDPQLEVYQDNSHGAEDQDVS